MADITRPTQGTGGQSTATQKAPLPGGEQRAEPRPAAGAASPQFEADRGRESETRNRQGGYSRAGERDEIGAIVEQAKQTVNDAYQQASRTVNETWGQTKEYSRENPGTATLVAFGVGVGVGVLLASGRWGSSRSRSQRLVPPVLNALSEITAELFRR